MDFNTISLGDLSHQKINNISNKSRTEARSVCSCRLSFSLSSRLELLESGLISEPCPCGCIWDVVGICPLFLTGPVPSLDDKTFSKQNIFLKSSLCFQVDPLFIGCQNELPNTLISIHCLEMFDDSGCAPLMVCKRHSYPLRSHFSAFQNAPSQVHLLLPPPSALCPISWAMGLTWQCHWPFQRPGELFLTFFMSEDPCGSALVLCSLLSLPRFY